MPLLCSTLLDKVVLSCFSLYDKLPKTGKPIEKEWTILSCIVKYEKSSGNIDVVSLGTGSKCIGATLMSPKGDILNDSHAEVFARRGFLLYLYENIQRALNNQSSIFTYENGYKFTLKDQIEFIFYSSQLPCGDASIVDKNEVTENIGDILQPLKRKEAHADHCEKRSKFTNDIYRTGAKCLPDSDQDPKAPGREYHLVGQVRTKPGRGDRTKSVSCSDKIAKWIHIGIQGRLLDMICGPIFIKHFIFGGTPYSEESLNRALLKREGYSADPPTVPLFYKTALQFSHCRTEKDVRPAPGSIVWVKLNKQLLEVAVQGRKLGLTKKKSVLPSSYLCISKYSIYKKFLELLRQHKELKHKILPVEGALSLVPYNKSKRKSTAYETEWLKIKENFFKSWTIKPDMWNFCVDISE